MNANETLELIEKLGREIKENVPLEEMSLEDLDKLQQMVTSVQKFIEDKMRKPN